MKGDIRLGWVISFRQYGVNYSPALTIVVKRGFTSIIVVVSCLVVSLWSYWTLQRREVVMVAQRGLNASWHTTVHIDGVKLDDPGSYLKWIILPFRNHDWFASYQVPHGNNPVGMVVISKNEQGKWVYIQDKRNY